MRITVKELEEIVAFANLKGLKEIELTTTFKNCGLNEIIKTLEVDFGDGFKLKKER